MNDDDLSDRLRRLVDRAQPVDLDEVTHRRPVRSNRTLVAAIAGAAVLALVAGAIALLRIDRDDAAPLTTDPPPTTLPAPTTLPVTTVPTATTAPPVGLVPQFVGVTQNGRLVVVDVATGEEVLELAAMADPTAPPEPDQEIAPNFIESVDVVSTVSPAQVVYGDCCEPASGNIFAIGMDGRPTTYAVVDHHDELAYVSGGTAPAVDGDGDMALSHGPGMLQVTRPDRRGSAGTIYSGDDLGVVSSTAWIDAPPYVLVYEAGFEPHSGIGLLTEDVDAAPVIHLPDGDADWTDPVPVGVPGRATPGILVVEVCCGDGTGRPSSYETSVGRILDPATGEVIGSIPFDGVVVDLDVSVTGGVLATFADGRVAEIDPATGEARVIAEGFVAASW